MNPESASPPEAWAEALARGESVRLRVKGCSMLPWLRDGEVVRIDPLTCPLQKGDVALVRRDESHPGLHRVIDLRGSGEAREAVCLGDSETGGEEIVPLAEILGVMHLSPFARWLYRLLARPRRWINRRLTRRNPRMPA